MDDTRMPKIINKKFYGRRPVGRPRLRWVDIRRDSSLLLNIRGRRSLVETGTSGDEMWNRPGPIRAVAILKQKNVQQRPMKA
jgi:hypothetical protein